MIEHVYRRASDVLPEVIVATDDTRILECVESFGGKAVMTSPHHRSGTDRCLEAYMAAGSDADIVVNIQGDEPFISRDQIEKLTRCFDFPGTEIATIIRPYDPMQGFAALESPDNVKATITCNNDVLTFSRSVIPYVKPESLPEWASRNSFYIHVGIYAYTVDALRKITSLPPSPLEQAESLEQLRWLENGYTIKAAKSQAPSIGIDTPDDLKMANERFLRENASEHHKSFFEQTLNDRYDH